MVTISRSGMREEPEHLPLARHAGLEVQALAVAQLDAAVLVLDQRARADEAHLAAQHVPQLGQLVERRAPQDAPHTGDPRVVGDLEQPVDRPRSATRAPRFISSAPSSIVRNFRISKTHPSRPTRRWRNSTGPRDSSLIARANAAIDGRQRQEEHGGADHVEQALDVGRRTSSARSGARRAPASRRPGRTRPRSRAPRASAAAR